MVFPLLIKGSCGDTWWWGDMLLLLEFPSSLELHTEELRMPFSDQVKYCILGISVTLLVVALGILLWQVFKCCTQTYTDQSSVNSDPMFSDDDSFRPGKYSGAPRTKVEEVGAEARRLSRCLSLGSFPSESSLAEGEQGEHIEPERQIHGSLRFSLYYDQLQSRLVVTVLQAEGLQGRNQKRSLHPFVRLRLMWAGPEEEEGLVYVEGEGKVPALRAVVEEWQTRVVKDSCSPSFGDQFSCTLQQQEEVHHIILRMEVRDFDKFSRHVILGEVRVPLGKFKISYPLELQEDLQIPQKDIVGEVLLSLKFLPTSQRLEVGLLKIRTLLTEAHSNTVLFARIGVQSNQCKLHHQKTSDMPQRQVTVFNQVLIFSLPELPLEVGNVLVSVYQSHTTRKSPKHLIGQLSVGKRRNSEDQHWSLMMRSVRQPIAEWHRLLI